MRFFPIFSVRNIVCLLMALLVGLVETKTSSAQANKALRQEDVERSIREGVRFLKSRQKADGSWAQPGFDQHRTGVTSLVTLSLLTAGEDPKSAPIQ